MVNCLESAITPRKGGKNAIWGRKPMKVRMLSYANPAIIKFGVKEG